MKRKSIESFQKRLQFVKPLYGKVKFRNRIRSDKYENVFRSEDISKLNRREYEIKSESTNRNNHKKIERIILKHENRQKLLPGECCTKNDSSSKRNFNQEIYKSREINVPGTKANGLSTKNVSTPLESLHEDKRNRSVEQKSTEQGIPRSVVHNISERWLRVYPASILPNETICSVIFRYLFCQLGLIVFLTLWTMLWIYIIHRCEGTHEAQVSSEFKETQTQVIVDLATELRQISSLSPKWREAIEKRMEEERALTILAVRRGARMNSGSYWDLPGALLFTIHVMTTLRFGVSAPHTNCGRTATLVYALFAVPAHIYLLINISKCVVINVEKLSARNIRKELDYNPKFQSSTYLVSNKLRKLIKCIYYIARTWRGVLISIILYYICGAILFGFMRNRVLLEVLFFPLDFTADLDHVEGKMRVLYSFYMEGAMVLLACALATLHRHSSNTINVISNKYRLLQEETCEK